MAVIAMFATVIPVAPVMAATSVPADTLAETCVRPSSGSSLFLPYVSSGVQGLVAGAKSLWAQPQAVTRELNYEVGKTYRYAYKADSVTSGFQRDSEGVSGEPISKVVIESIAEVTVTGQNADGSYDGQVVLSNVFACGAALAPDSTEETIIDNPLIVEALQTPILFTQTSTGEITSVQIAQDANLEVLNYQKGVISALQVNLQEGDNYIATERGNQGSYNAAYQLAEQDNLLTINKSYDNTSFTDLIHRGENEDALIIDASTEAVLDGTKGILTSVIESNTVANGSESFEPDGSNAGFDGIANWTQVDTSSSIVFESVESAHNVQSATLTAVYFNDDLGNTLSDDDPVQVDWSQIDLEQETNALVTTPTDTNAYLRIMELVNADDEVRVLDKIAEKLATSAANDDAAAALIDVLIEAGTPYAQNILSGVLGNQAVQAADLSATMSITTEEHALIGLVLLESPTITTITTIKNISEVDATLQDTAISVLGAAVDRLSTTDEQMADEINNTLLAGLASSNDEEEISVYLDALGNAGDIDSLDSISEYITNTLTLGNGDVLTDTEDIQIAALGALRNIPGEEAEGLMVAALQDDEASIGIRLTLYDALLERPNLSAAGVAALQESASLANIGTEENLAGVNSLNASNIAMPQTFSRYSRSWDKRFGNKYIGLDLPGRFSSQNYISYFSFLGRSFGPKTPGLYLYAYQDADALLAKKRFNIASASVTLRGNKRRDGKPSDKYTFGAYLNLLNYRIKKKYENNFNCQTSRNGKVWDGRTSKSWSIKIPIPKFPDITLKAGLGAYARLDYSMNVNLCNPNNMTGRAAIIPSGYATGYGEASASILWGAIKGGAGVKATLLDSRFTLELRANGKAANLGSIRVCVDVNVRMQAIRGEFYVSGKALWFLGGSVPVYKFSTATRTYSLYDRCWPS